MDHSHVLLVYLFFFIILSLYLSLLLTDILVGVRPIQKDDSESWQIETLNYMQEVQCLSFLTPVTDVRLPIVIIVSLL